MDMIEHLLHPRITETKDWATVLFVFAIFMISVSKSVYEKRFGDFMNLVFSDKYTKIYRDSIHLKSSFTVGLFLVQLISFAFFIQLTLSFFGHASKFDWLLYIQIITALVFFILSKFLIEKIIATSFNIEEFVEQFNLQKLTYRSYAGLFILLIDIILFYFDFASKNVLIVITAVLLITNGITYLISIKNYQKLIFGKMFYFILYLCTLEIAPYYFIYYWFTKGYA
jgi:Domain of unknown function (DUF4271)